MNEQTASTKARQAIIEQHTAAMKALPPKQRAIVEHLMSSTFLFKEDVSQFSKSAIKELVKQGIIEKQFAFTPSNYFYDFTWQGRDTYYLDGLLDDLEASQ